MAATLHNLAAVLVERGRHREAERYYRRALAIQRRLLGNDSPDVALTANNLGRLLATLGRREEAIALLREAVAVLQARLAPAIRNLRKARKNLRNALRNQKPL